MRIDLTDLRLFVNIAEAASITRGAERSHLSLPAASARVRSMEEACGVALLERGRRGVRVLPAGESLLVHARSVLGRMEQLASDLNPLAARAKARVRVLSNTAALYDIVPHVVARYLCANPEIDIELSEQGSEDIAREIADGKAEVGILADSADLSRLQTFALRSDQLVLVVPADGDMAVRDIVALDEVLDRSFIGLGAPVAFQQYVERHAARAGGSMKFRVRVPTFDAVCDMVQRRIGLGIVPHAAALRCASMNIRAVRIRDRWASRNLALGVRDMAALSPPARRLVEHFQAMPSAAD
jgi:DNA-binding transcriptional LysR family regulator